MRRKCMYFDLLDEIYFSCEAVNPTLTFDSSADDVQKICDDVAIDASSDVEEVKVSGKRPVRKEVVPRKKLRPSVPLRSGLSESLNSVSMTDDPDKSKMSKSVQKSNFALGVIGQVSANKLDWEKQKYEMDRQAKKEEINSMLEIEKKKLEVEKEKILLQERIEKERIASLERIEMFKARLQFGKQQESE